MRWTLTFWMALLYLLFPQAGHAEWQAFDALKEGTDEDSEGNIAGAYSCPEGTRYTSFFNGARMRYEDKCESEDYGKVRDHDRDGVNDAYQTSILTYEATATNPLVSTWSATHIGVSENNSFLMNTNAVDKAILEFQTSDNPFIEMVRSQGRNIDASMVDQVRSNIDLQEKIRQKIGAGGGGYVGQFDRFMGR